MFIFSIVLLSLAALLLIVGAFMWATRRDRDAIGGPSTTAAGVICALIGVAIILGCSYNKVPPKTVGIETAWGTKATGVTYDAGVHWLDPWKGIADWDATRQSYNHLGDKCEKPGDGSLWVSISGQRQACIRVQINWETTTKDAAVKNWSTYKGLPGSETDHFSTFVTREVDPGFNDALLATFRTFDPLALVDKTTGEAQAPDLAGTYTKTLTTEIDKRLGARTDPATAVSIPADIRVMSLNWGLIGYDGPTTVLISQYAQKVLESRNLNVDKQNAASRSTVAKDSGIPAAVQACLDQIKATGHGEPGLCMGGSGVALTKNVG